MTLIAPERRRSRTRAYFRSLYLWATAFGIDPLRFWYGLRGLPRFAVDYVRFRHKLGPARTKWPIALSAPCLGDRWLGSGETRGHYFIQDLFVARKIFQRQPFKHVDVGSRVDGFVAHVASFREITVFDIRPPQRSVANIRFIQQDITDLPADMRAVADSVSCLHALEHFGLGRYGDRIATRGHEVGLRNIVQLVAPGGILYLSVPVGQQRIEFNGHRIFSFETVLELARAEGLELVALSYIDDSGELHENVCTTPEMRKISAELDYGCGIFELRRKPSIDVNVEL